MVIFFADNGRLEARGIHWCWDSGLHVPTIIHWPKNFPALQQYEAGTVNDQVISLLDLTATTLRPASIERPAGMQSRNFPGKPADAPKTTHSVRVTELTKRSCVYVRCGTVAITTSATIHPVPFFSHSTVTKRNTSLSNC